VCEGSSVARTKTAIRFVASSSGDVRGWPAAARSERTDRRRTHTCTSRGRSRWRSRAGRPSASSCRRPGRRCTVRSRRSRAGRRHTRSRCDAPSAPFGPAPPSSDEATVAVPPPHAAMTTTAASAAKTFRLMQKYAPALGPDKARCRKAQNTIVIVRAVMPSTVMVIVSRTLPAPPGTFIESSVDASVGV